MAKQLSSQAKVTLNVRVVLGTPDADGRINVRTDRRFKNTATRLMTESICNYLTGAENTYKRGKGRPNYMGIGTMGITKQPYGTTQTAEVEADFDSKEYNKGVTTRPWFESTSLALTDVCGPTNPDERGISQHFWDAELGWGKNGFTGEASDKPVFQGELCTSRIPKHDGEPAEQDGWDTIGRIPILRSDVLSDCPADWDYGTDGYCSQAIWYGYASVEWVHNLLKPNKRVYDEETKTWSTVSVGPQLDTMAISEFGLYEKTNTDPHGLETMLAGFRVPSEDDIIYVNDGEVILIEWRVTVRALMPSEGVLIVSEPAPTGLNIYAEYLGETDQQDKKVQFTGVVRGDAGVRQGITWSIDNNPDYSSRTHIDNDGLLIVGNDETEAVVYVTGASIVDPFILSKTAVLTGLLKDFVTGINLTTESIDDLHIQFRALVLGRGNYGTGIHWEMTGAEHPGTTITQTGLLTIDFEETSEEFKITATSTADAQVYSVAAVVLIDKTSGTYVISDFTILTEGGDGA